jgi:hypothetical protein
MKMIKRTAVPVLIATLVFLAEAGAQMTSSPYSIFGAGQVEDNGFGVSRAMGGTGIGLKSTNSLNNINPASYGGIDSLSFLFEVGVFAGYTRSESRKEIQHQFDGNMRYLALGCRVTRWWASSLGIVPFSTVGYTIKSTGNIEGELTPYTKTYTGEGGLNQFYFSNAFSPIKNLSLGLNLAYVFGSITQNESMSTDGAFKGYLISKTQYVHNINLDYGIQYTLNAGKWGYTLGLTYGAKRNLKSSTDYYLAYANDTIELEGESNDFVIPAKYGIGLGVEKGRKFRAGLDYERRDWSSAQFTNIMLSTRSSDRISAGLEYLPLENYRDEWYKKLTYRLGATYKKSYLLIDDVPINSKSVSFGVGIPLRNAYTMINVALEAGQNGTIAKGLIKENYLILHFNLSLHDIWFLKPKYD